MVLFLLPPKWLVDPNKNSTIQSSINSRKVPALNKQIRIQHRQVSLFLADVISNSLHESDIFFLKFCSLIWPRIQHPWRYISDKLSVAYTQESSTMRNTKIKLSSRFTPSAAEFFWVCGGGWKWITIWHMGWIFGSTQKLFLALRMRSDLSSRTLATRKSDVIIPVSAARCISYKVHVENVGVAGSSETQVHKEKTKNTTKTFWLKRQGKMGSV